MRIAKLLEAKGAGVATVAPTATVAEVVDELARHGVGALVVSADGRAVEGIVSERDVVRRLADRGPGVLTEPVAAIMATEVQVAGPDDAVESLMALMTDRRIRHVPVLHDGALVGIVSIGDVVKHRLDELEGDKRALVDYIHAR